jgi:hypothetical protein
LQAVPLHAACKVVPRHGQPSAALPLQFCQSGAHVYMHVPAEQLTSWTNGSPVQSTQFAPHADAFVIWSTQVPLHMPIPAGHEQVPLTQVEFAPQLCPQVPQFVALVERLTQPPLHSVSPVGHCDRHIPAEHTSPDGHGAPQAPQFWALVIRFTHAPEHSVSPLEQVVLHLPATHVWPDSHLCAQCPQLRTSV